MGSSVSKTAGERNGAALTLAADSEDDDAGGGIRGIRPRNQKPSHTAPERKNTTEHGSRSSVPHTTSSTAKNTNAQQRQLPARRVMTAANCLERDPLDDALVDSLAFLKTASDRKPAMAAATAASGAESAARTLDRCLFRPAPTPPPPEASMNAVCGEMGSMAPVGTARDSLKVQAQPMLIPASTNTGSGSLRSAPQSQSASTQSAVSLLSNSGSTSGSSIDSALTPESLHNFEGLYTEWTLGPNAAAAAAAVASADANFNLASLSTTSNAAASQASSSADSGLMARSSCTGIASGTDSISSDGSSSTANWLNGLIRRICVSGVKGKKGSSFVLSTDEVRKVARASATLLLEEPVLLRIPAPVKIVGDLHGQFKDLLRILRTCGMPPYTTYLFLGDYVDRGKQSLETLLLLLCLKLRYPQHVHLLRGNHECANVTRVYGFYDETKRRLGVRSWRQLVDVFNVLPIAAIVGQRIFCVHGGLSPSLSSFSDIERVQRPTDIPGSGLVSDLLWSDPDSQVKDWIDNDRGVSFCFGKRVLDRFCKQFGVDLVARGHMVVEDGYEFFGQRRLVTIFSAPNYCGDFDNWGAVMSVDSQLLCTFELIEPLNTMTRQDAKEQLRQSKEIAATPALVAVAPPTASTTANIASAH